MHLAHEGMCLFVCDFTTGFRKCDVPACQYSSPSGLTCTVCRIDAKQLSNSHWAKHSLGWRGLACGQRRLNTSSENQHRRYSCNKQRRRTRWVHPNREPGSVSTGSTLTRYVWLSYSRFVHSKRSESKCFDKLWLQVTRSVVSHLFDKPHFLCVAV